MTRGASDDFWPRARADLLRHGLSTLAICAIIALALTASAGGDWGRQLVYSFSIGILSWLVIDVGRLLLTRHEKAPWPQGLRGVLLVVAGIAVGALGGSAIGDAWAGRPMLAFWRHAPNQFAATLAITLAATIGICYFYYSRGRSKYLEAEIALAQRDAADARLRLLETQLEPHMLFNTLANLRALIATDPARAVAMLDHLDSYLRMTLAGSRALVHPLEAEFARLGDYLALMAVRMGERLACTLDLPEDLRTAQVPPLVLQPLVENSIRHGLEPRVEGGEITVRARREGDRLVIEVRDTGAGLGGMPSHAADDEGFGLAQVRERLATLYGAQAALTLQPNPGGGACAVLTLPISPERRSPAR